MMLNKFYGFVSALLKEDGISGSINPGESSVRISIAGLPVFLGVLEKQEGIAISCPVAPIIHTNDMDKIAKELLILNSKTRWNRGCTFGINGDDMVVVDCFIPFDGLTEAGFLKRFEVFEEVMLDNLTEYGSFVERVLSSKDMTPSELADTFFMMRV